MPPAAATTGSSVSGTKGPNSFLFKHDNRAGVDIGYYTNKREKTFEVQIRFRDGEPPPRIAEYMKNNGFHSDPEAVKAGHFNVAGAWVFPTEYESRASARLHAMHVFDTVVEMMLTDKSIQPSGRNR